MIRKRSTESIGKLFSTQSDTSDDLPLAKRPRVTPPTKSRSNPTTVQQTPVSPAPLATMISSHRKLPKLFIPQPLQVTIPERPAQETSTIAASTIRTKFPTSGQAWGGSQPTSGSLTATSARSPQHQLQNTKLKIYLHGGKGYRPLLLKDCMTPSSFFTQIIATWSLLDDSVNRLHVTFPWLPADNDGRLMVLERRDVKAGLVCICDEVESAPCWAEERGHCSIHVTVIPNARMMGKSGKVDRPMTRDGRSIPDMSVNANRVYWAMRANSQADVGLHVRRVATMLGMNLEDVVEAGDELLEHCLILTSDEDYGVWSLLEV